MVRQNDAKTTPNVNLLQLNLQSHSLGNLVLCVPLPTDLCLLPGEATLTKGCRGCCLGRGRDDPLALVAGTAPDARDVLCVFCLCQEIDYPNCTYSL